MCPCVIEYGILDGEHGSIVLDGEFGIVHLFARVSARVKGLRATLYPLDWPAEPAGNKADQHLFGIHLVLDAEPTTHVPRLHADRVFPNPQAAGDGCPDLVGSLRRRVDGEQLFEWVWDGNAASRFEGETAVTVAVEPRLDHEVGLGKGRSTISLAHAYRITGLVCAPLIIEQGSPGRECLFHVDDRRQR